MLFSCRSTLRDVNNIGSMCRLILFYCISFSPIAYTQNLVPNPGFELYHSCPTTAYGEIDKLMNWYDVHVSPDFYNCSVGIPNNKYGNQFPNSGSGHVGEYSTEIIGVKLTEPLEYNKTYSIEFYVSLADGFPPIQKIGLHFSQDSICSLTDISELHFSNSSGIIDDSTNWTKISGTYLAQGCERYLAVIVADTIGSYYYFDDFLIECADPGGCSSTDCNYSTSIQIPNVFTPNNDGINDLFKVKVNNSEPSFLECIILNRWGTKVAEIKYPSTTWDGTWKGNDVEEGVYFYSLGTMRSECGEFIYKNGFIHVFR